MITGLSKRLLMFEQLSKMKNLPNLLTMFRLAVVPLIILGAFFDNLWVRICLILLYCAAAFSDFLDGYLARQYNMISNFGRIFDPISDKILVLGTLLMVTVRDGYLAELLLIPFAIIMTRELMVAGIREGLSSSHVIIKVSSKGKYKTAFQMLALGFLIAGNKVLPFVHADIVGLILLWLATVLTVITAVEYVLQSRKHLKP